MEVVLHGAGKEQLSVYGIHRVFDFREMLSPISVYSW